MKKAVREVLLNLSFPGYRLARVVENHYPDSGIQDGCLTLVLGTALTVLGAPITIPCAFAGGSVLFVYDNLL